MRALQEAFVLKIGDVLVHGGEGAKVEARGDFFVRGRVAILRGEGGEEIDHFFLPTRDSHAAILANKKRTASEKTEESGLYIAARFGTAGDRSRFGNAFVAKSNPKSCVVPRYGGLIALTPIPVILREKRDWLQFLITPDAELYLRR